MTSSISGSILPQPQVLMPSSTKDPVAYVMAKYVRLLSEIEEWSVRQLQFRQNAIRRILEPSRTRIAKLKVKLQTREMRRKKGPVMPLRVFLVGRKGSGKSDVVKALLNEHAVEQNVVFVGVRAASVTMVRGQVNGREVEFYEMPCPLVKQADLPANSLQSIMAQKSESMHVWPNMVLIQDFIMQRDIVPDVILLVETAKEMHTSLPLDLEIVRCLLWQMRRSLLVSVDVPVLGVMTQTDDVYPADLKRPDEYDEEKLALINRLIHMADETCGQPSASSGKPWADLKLNDFRCIPVSSRVFWNPNAQGEWAVIPSRDYRYNIDLLADTLSKAADGWIWDESSHLHFALHLVHLFRTIAHALSGIQLDLLKKYQLEAYLVSIISLELASPVPVQPEPQTPAFDPRDPTSFVEGVRDFWLTLGLQNITYHSLKTVASQLLEAMPLGQVVSASVTAGSGISLGLEDVTERLGQACVAYFVERRARPSIARLFQGSETYS